MKIKYLKRYWKFLILAGVIAIWGRDGARAQQPSPVTTLAKCVIPFVINSTGVGAQGHFQPSTVGYDNRQTGCTNWNYVYSSSGYTVISIRLESAPPGSNVAPGTPGTYVTWAGTTVSGSQPNTAITQASSTFSGYFPWVRINATTLTGTGQIVGVLIGTLPIDTSGGSAGTTGCVGTAVTPCIVAGPVANGAVLGTDPPVRIGGSDGARVRDIQTNTSGDVVVVDNIQQQAVSVLSQNNNVNALEGGNISKQVVFPFNFEGGTYQTAMSCPSFAVISTSSSGNTELVALLASTRVRICEVNWVSDSPISVSLIYGTGSACATGETGMTGVMNNVSSYDVNFMGTLRTANSNALCIKLGSAIPTRGVVTYAQF